MTTPAITLFGKPGCGPCTALQAHLKLRGYPYTYEDVTACPDALEAVQKQGFRGVPVIRIGDTWTGGFDPAAVDRMVKTYETRQAEE